MDVWAYKVLGTNVLDTLGKDAKLRFRQAKKQQHQDLRIRFKWGVVHTADKPGQVADETNFIFRADVRTVP